MYVSFDNLYGYQTRISILKRPNAYPVPTNYTNGDICKIDLETDNITVLDGNDLTYYINNKDIIEEEVKNYNSLRLYEFMDPSENKSDIYVKNKDFTIVGLDKTKLYEKGRKLYSDYRHPDTNELVVKKIFNDIIDSNNKLIGIDINFEWYNKNDVAKLSKNVKVNFTQAQVEQYEQERRNRCLAHMIGSVKNTPLESMVNYIYNYYNSNLNDSTMKTENYGKTYITDYILLHKYDEFVNALTDDKGKSQTLHPISAYLNQNITVYTGVNNTVYDFIVNTLYTR